MAYIANHTLPNSWYSWQTIHKCHVLGSVFVHEFGKNMVCLKCHELGKVCFFNECHELSMVCRECHGLGKVWFAMNGVRCT